MGLIGRGQWQLRSSFISSIISTTLVLYALGMLLLVMVNARRLTDYVRENFVFSLVLQENVKEVDAQFLSKELSLEPFVKEVEYVSRERAAEEFTQYLGEDFLSLLGCNPLQPSLELHLRAAWANNDSMQRIASYCQERPHVVKVEYERDKVKQMNQNLQRMSLVLVAFSVVMSFIALVLINNTIRISIYARRFIIKTMQLVGATARFTRQPFLLRAFRHALYASALAMLLILQTILLVQRELYEFVNLHQYKLLLAIGVCILLVGVLINVGATYFAVNKYLRASVDRLYR